MKDYNENPHIEVQKERFKDNPREYRIGLGVSVHKVRYYILWIRIVIYWKYMCATCTILTDMNSVVPRKRVTHQMDGG